MNQSQMVDFSWPYLLFILLAVSSATAQDSLLVLTSTPVFADMADNIAGGRLKVESIIPLGTDPHSYLPSEADGELLKEADLLLFNGWGLEPWLDTLLRLHDPGLTVYRLSDNIQAVKEPDGNPDPHAWLSAENGLVYLDNVQKALSTLAPYDADIFDFNHGLYRQQLLDLDLSVQSALIDIPGPVRLLPTWHNPFRYFGERYGFRTAALRKEAEALPGAPVLFYESIADTAFLLSLAKKRGASLAGPLYTCTLSESTGPAASYLEMLAHNSSLITQTLSLASQPREPAPVYRHYIWPVLLLLGALLVWRLFRLYRQSGQVNQERK